MTEVPDRAEILSLPAEPCPSRSAGRLLPWLGGARDSVLRRCPGERSLYGGLGLGVLLTAVIGGLAATLAMSFVLRVPAGRAWPGGVVWGLVIGNLDRMLLVVTASRTRLLAMVPRLLISAFLGVLIAEPLTVRIFQPEISAELAVMQQHQQAAELDAIMATYQPKITADDRRIAGNESRLAGTATRPRHHRQLLKVTQKEITLCIPTTGRRQSCQYPGLALLAPCQNRSAWPAPGRPDRYYVYPGRSNER